MTTILTPGPDAQAAADDAGPTPKKKQALRCDDRHMQALRREIRDAGLALRGTTGKTQCQTLVRVFTYLGDRGLNTPEAAGLGYYRIATRVQELEAAGYVIATVRESVLDSEGLLHVGIVRYILLDKRSETRQLSLDLGGV